LPCFSAAKVQEEDWKQISSSLVEKKDPTQQEDK
jgi:hypothetical protein